MLRPVLEVHVLWHPLDHAGAEVADDLAQHFHGGVFANLLAGAMELYRRSPGWRHEADAPRPIPWPDQPPPPGHPWPARFVAVVLLAGRELGRAVRDPGNPWAAYVADVLAAQARDPAHVRVLPLRLGTALSEWLAGALPPNQFLGATDPLAAAGSAAADPAETRALRRRDLAQALAQWLNPEPEAPLRVFISHTKRMGSADERVDRLVETVRAEFAAGRVASFYDAHDLAPGADWDQALRSRAASSALLALRTDLYASREWCQREMLTAKLHGMPVVVLDALSSGETRGSFLMDHTPRIPLRRLGPDAWDAGAVRRAINLLADAWLHRVLWLHQQRQAVGHDGLARYWWAPQAPEPSTLARWLSPPADGAAAAAGSPASAGAAVAGTAPLEAPRMPSQPPGAELRILHPDPPLATDEREVLQQLVHLAGYGHLDLTTPRLLAARGA